MKNPTLSELLAQVEACRLCPLGETRTNAVFGGGNPDADLMFVGEAPGYHEDRQGEPFVGRAGRLLDELLERMGLRRNDVYIANVLKCRPPGNRDPQADEIERCRGYLEGQIAAIQPQFICTLGNFSTKLLSGKPDGISRVHGAAQPLPGSDNIHLYPVFHPAAALYTPANLAALKDDFDRLAQMLTGASAAPSADTPGVAPDTDPSEQLGLF